MRVKLLSVLWLVCLAGQVLSPRAAAQDDVAVVVNAANPVASLSLIELRKLFSGEKRFWPGNIPVRLIVRAPGCRERTALLKLLNLSESDYKQYWTAQVFRGQADSEPFVAPSVGMSIEAVKSFPGAITLINANDTKPGVKIVKVAGLLPGAAGYPLH